MYSEIRGYFSERKYGIPTLNLVTELSHLLTDYRFYRVIDGAQFKIPFHAVIQLSLTLNNMFSSLCNHRVHFSFHESSKYWHEFSLFNDTLSIQWAVV